MSRPGPAKADSRARLLYLPLPLSAAVERAAQDYGLSITAYVRGVLLGQLDLPELRRGEVAQLRKMGLDV